ncbi:hypothetical protein GCM10020218_047320 [Dactylosporangium vinaceum]
MCPSREMPAPTGRIYVPFHRFSGVSHGVSPESDGQHVRRSHTYSWVNVACRKEPPTRG